MNNYTSIEQSKKLLELGLNPETADMYFREWKRQTKLIKIANVGRAGEEDLPCWSVGALLELMPHILELQGLRCILDIRCHPKSYTIYYIHEDFCPAGTVDGKTLIDACSNMVVWLLENGYINKVKDENL